MSADVDTLVDIIAELDEEILQLRRELAAATDERDTLPERTATEAAILDIVRHEGEWLLKWAPFAITEWEILALRYLNECRARESE